MHRTRTMLDPGLRDEVARMLRARLGLAFPASREPILDQGVHDVLDRLGESSAAVLLARLRGDDARAWAALAAAVTVGETYFFRDPAHYEFLRRLLGAAAPGHRVRLWSAACANGAEAYSMAAVAREVFGDAAAARVDIIGTDIDPEALHSAHAGLYRTWSLREMSAATRARWFTRADGCWRVQDSLRELVDFQRLNLSDPRDPAWPAAVDVVFCRNVLVYLSDEAIDRACEGFQAALRPHGWLVTGPSEPLLARPELTLDASHGFIAYRRNAPGSAPASRGAPRSAAQRRAAPLAPVPRAASRAAAPASPVSRSRPHAPAQPPPAPPAPDSLARLRALADTGDPRAAIHELDVALAREPLSAEAYLLRATLRQAMGDHRGVIAETRRALLLDRQLAYAHMLAATSHLALGDRVATCRALRNALVLLAGVPGDAIVTGAGASGAELHAACRQLMRAIDRQQISREP